MRTKKLLAGGLLVASLVVGTAAPAAAADPGKAAGKELVECVEKALHDHKAEIAKKDYKAFTNALDNCRKAKSLFTPQPSEIIWGAIAFAIVAFALIKFAFPALRKGMTARSEKIREDLEGAEQARTEAEAERARYEARLGEARAEGSRIVEEAHQAAEQVRRELIARAEADAAEVRQRAQEDAALAADRAMRELRTEVTQLSVELAEKIVEHNLDHDTQVALVESYIASVGTGGK